MVVNLCLPQFHTTVHCNKLCADGYDVTNLVSDDPALRSRGFKLEYFLRPPVQVTLKFGFQVELSRVDVELWPWGMDRGQTSKRLEISTYSDPIPSHSFEHGCKEGRQKQQMQMRVKNQNEQHEKRGQEYDRDRRSSSHHWSLQAQRWGQESEHGPRQSVKERPQTNAESSQPEPEFKLVGRCELREETQVCFSHTKCRPRPPFPSPPPPQPVNCQQQELWSRGPPSLGAVTQLRVTVPFGGAASALGFKALSVWGQPSRACSAQEVKRIKVVHEASNRPLPQPGLFGPSVRETKPPLQADTPQSNHPVPEEFLDPLTQEIMALPMLLPSGVSVDNSTLEEFKKREATWGRLPNDPFTGVPFTPTSQPLPNPQLKTRIDHFVLQTGEVRREGTLGRRGEGENPQASRLVAPRVDGRSENSHLLNRDSTNNAAVQNDVISRNLTSTTQVEGAGLGESSDAGNPKIDSQPLTKGKMDQKKKRNLSTIPNEATEEKQLLPQTKRPRNNAVSDCSLLHDTTEAPSCSSHEQRLSASLDEALFSALKGRPSFTSNLTHQRRVTPDPETPLAAQQSHRSGSSNIVTSDRTCSACSCSVSVYSTSSSSPIYRLSCAHLLCGACLRRQARPLNSVGTATSNHVSCPTCQSSTPRSDIMRVHH